MANKGVELINKLNRHDTQIDEIAETLDMQRSKRKEMEIDITQLRNEFELDIYHNKQRFINLHESVQLHHKTIINLIKDVNALHKWLAWQSVSVAVLALALFARLFWG